MNRTTNWHKWRNVRGKCFRMKWIVYGGFSTSKANISNQFFDDQVGDEYIHALWNSQSYVMAFSTCTAALHTDCEGGSSDSITSCLYSALFCSSLRCTMSSLLAASCWIQEEQAYHSFMVNYAIYLQLWFCYASESNSRTQETLELRPLLLNTKVVLIVRCSKFQNNIAPVCNSWLSNKWS